MIRLIAAIDDKRGLAKNGVIPWDLPSDKARFRKLTLTNGANALLGSTTYELMPGSYLKERNIYVVSHRQLKLPSTYHLVNDPIEFLKTFKEDVWVIGGAGLFASIINVADELYLTLVKGDFNCDQFFPDYSAFKQKSTEGPFNENDLSFSYQLFTRF